MSEAPLHRAGERFLLDPAGLVFWPARRTLIVADLHLEKASSYARRGSMLPPYDSATTLERLSVAMRRFRPERVIALGDSFHDSEGTARLGREASARLARLAAEAEFLWITGNHDPSLDGLPGNVVQEHRDGVFVFRHEAAPLARGAFEFSGHFHPKARVATRGRAIRRACFVADRSRLMLPAFGAYAGGLDVTSPAIRAVFPRAAEVFLLGRDRVFAFPLAACSPLAAEDEAAPDDTKVA